MLALCLCHTLRWLLGCLKAQPLLHMFITGMFWHVAARPLHASWGRVRAGPPEESVQFALSVSWCPSAVPSLAAHLRRRVGQALRQLHQAHQQSSATQHQTGPHQCKQGVLPAHDGVLRVPRTVSEARCGAHQLCVQVLFHFLNFPLKFCSGHPTFRYVETLGEKKEMIQV